MKKLLLLSLTLVLGMSVAFSQQYQLKESVQSSKKIDNETTVTKGVKDISNTVSEQERPVREANQKSSRDLTIKNLGNAANAYSYFGNQRTYLWVNTDLNTISHAHRMTADARYSGDLALDISKDGGESFENNIMVYESNISGGQYNIDAIRYPQNVIYNPEGNTDPDNAKTIFFGPVLDGTNSDWGGYAYGYANLGDYADTSKNLQSSSPGEGIYQLIPNAMTMQPGGTYWVVDPSEEGQSGSYTYTDNLIINKGTYSDSEGDVTLEQSLLEAPVVEGENGPVLADHKIAFGEDGQVGYIGILGNDGSVEFSADCYYPIIFKTTDGGETWENLGGVQLGGPDGIPSIVNEMLTDDQIGELYEPPVPDREEIPYTTAFDFDMVVDNEGDLHIAAVVGVLASDPYSIASGEDFVAALDIFTVDGGMTWNAVELRNIKRFRGNYGDILHDNRIQASKTDDGEKVFISWLDTDPEFSDEENNQPDIWTAGVDLEAGMHTPPVNVTEFTEAWGAAFFGIAPNKVFDNGDTYEIPFTYQDMDPNDPIQPVQYKYIKGFTISEADFTDTIPGVLTDVKKQEFNQASVSQNYPNPFSTTSTINVTTEKRASVSLKVVNMVGQTVYTADKGEVPAGKKQFTIDASNLKAGVYFYTVTVNEEKVTKKMIVE